MQTVNINILYLPPHLLHFLSHDPLLSSCGVVCSAGSRCLDTELRRPSQVPADFKHCTDWHLKGSFLPSTYSCFIFSFTPSTHMRLVSLHLIARFSCVYLACLNKQFRLGSQVALGKIILNVINNTIINTVGYISVFNKWLLDKGLKSICKALSSTAGSSGRRCCPQLWNQHFPAEIQFLTNDLCHLVLMNKGNTV